MIFKMGKKKKKILAAVAWPYVNGDIHIGHLAGYLFPADIYARFNRLIGNEVLMVSGSDCYGTPITLEADKRGIRPEDIVAEYHEKNKRLFQETLKLSFDIYTKTTTENHHGLVRDTFVRLAGKGFIFRDTANQYYSESERRFLPDRYVEGKCPKCGYEEARSDQCDKCGLLFEQGELLNPRSKVSGTPVILRPSEHYFLDWPKLEPFLKEYIDSKRDWRPWVLNETKGWLDNGLRPRAITRDIDWGVPIPTDRLPEDLRIEGAEHKRIYVWFEAVMGYLSATIEWAKINKKDWKEWWYGEDLLHAYFMGKDNLVFHTLFWPGELHGYDERIHLPDKPFVNQFLNLEGRKFSKSRGITIDSEYIVRTYGLDPVRFYLASINPESADTNFAWDDFVAKVNDVLIGNFGNFINRTLTLAEGVDLDGVGVDKEVEEKILATFGRAEECLSGGSFRDYLNTILELSDFGNKYLSGHEPWKIKKTNPEEFRRVIKNALFLVEALHIVSAPLLPETSGKISDMLGVSPVAQWPITRVVEHISETLKRAKISEAAPLFQKIDPEVAEKERSRLSSN